MNVSLWMPLALGLMFAVWGVLLVRSRAQRATPVRADDPWFLAAMQRARDSYPAMQALLAEGEQVAVKFALKNASGDIEHVWGGVGSADAEGVDVVVLTPMLEGGTPNGPLKVQRADVEDWQAFVADGGIRGGFTTQAQLAVCQREKIPIPRALRDQSLRFLDPIEFPPSERAP